MDGYSDLCERISDTADTIADILEGKRGLKHERHQAHLAPAKSAVKGVLRRYFRRQGDAILLEVAPHIRSHVEQFQEADKRTNGKRFADSLIPNSLSPLRFAVSDTEDASWAAAITSAIEGATKVARQELAIGTSAAPNVAASYLRDHSLSKLTGNIADTSKDRLRNAVAEAWDAGGSYEDIVGAIKTTFSEFSTTRASMIAQTEVVDAYNAGRRSTAGAGGMDEHSWETESGNPCPTCTANEDEGWIPMDQPFSSGDLSPTAHPNCECLENFRRSSDAGTDEG